MVNRAHQVIDAFMGGNCGSSYRVEKCPQLDRRLQDIKTAMSFVRDAQKFDATALESSKPLYETALDWIQRGIFFSPFTYAYFDFQLRVKSGGAPDHIFATVICEREPQLRYDIACFSKQDGMWIDIGMYGEINNRRLQIARYFPENAYLDYERQNTLCGHYVQQTLSAIVALSARGVELAAGEVPSQKTNAARVARGHAPLFEHKVIKVGGFSKSGNLIAYGGTHASPRAHWRRGHHRNLKGGRVIPIPACFVGDIASGAVTHDYKIAASVGQAPKTEAIAP